ncbi:NAD-dependent epimerase/dehydratase family protein [Tomitella fengzijianii]|uniref:NAD(P)-dependent oxidoreductase n=1 Tax=Tomitella fengzijianii TaxID=2597660 RepID=A0A516X721_9ACTN|nr:NAD(P)-dependent oxidoreductase [Tomitella fengzijianii]QDQ98869.1 NAD(P)-dependent oxidoreductase [Tomitella fengzijianii]
MSNSPEGTARRVVLLGAAGATGRSALEELRRSGYEVVAHSRRVGTGAELPHSGDDGVRWVGGDLLGDGAHLRRVLDGADAVVDMRVALPTSLRTAGVMRQYRAVRDGGVRALVDAALQFRIPRIVHDTVTMIYRDGGDAWLDETSPVSAPGPMRANLAGEAHVRRFTEGGGTGVSLRLGQVHGAPADDPMMAMIESAARRGWFALAGREGSYMSSIALSDVGRAVVAALDAPAGLYNVAEEPRTRGEWRREFARRVGREDLHTLPGVVAGPLGRSQRVSSARFADVTGWRPEAELFGI